VIFHFFPSLEAGTQRARNQPVFATELQRYNSQYQNLFTTSPQDPNKKYTKQHLKTRKQLLHFSTAAILQNHKLRNSTKVYRIKTPSLLINSKLQKNKLNYWTLKINFYSSKQ
jgi:hypothetical protein